MQHGLNALKRGAPAPSVRRYFTEVLKKQGVPETIINAATGIASNTANTPPLFVVGPPSDPCFLDANVSATSAASSATCTALPSSAVEADTTVAVQVEPTVEGGENAQVIMNVDRHADRKRAHEADQREADLTSDAGAVHPKKQAVVASSASSKPEAPRLESSRRRILPPLPAAVAAIPNMIDIEAESQCSPPPLSSTVEAPNGAAEVVGVGEEAPRESNE